MEGQESADSSPRKTVARLTECATQCGVSLGPFLIIKRLPRPEIDAKCTEFRRAPRLRCVRVDINARGDFESYKAGSDDRRMELCFQQSAGDSPLPQIDVALCLVAKRFLDQDVADLKPPAWL